MSSLNIIAEEYAQRINMKIERFSGKGAFKETYCIKDKNNIQFALKLVPAEKFNSLRTEREINALKMCETPLIGKLFDFGEFVSSYDRKKYYFSIEEYLDGGTLSDKINNTTLSPVQVKSYGITLIKTITYLKNKNLVHRDIKPDNIMFRSSSPDPVLVDLGIVRDLSTTSLTQTWISRGPGTPYFSSPEQLNNDKYLINWRSDQFSLGIVLGICLTGRHPFQERGMRPEDAVEAIANRKKFSDSFRDKIQSHGFKCLLKMLAPWPIQRFYSPEDLLKNFKGVKI